MTTGASAALLVPTTNRPGVYANVRSYGPSVGGLSLSSAGWPRGSYRTFGGRDWNTGTFDTSETLRRLVLVVMNARAAKPAAEKPSVSTAMPGDRKAYAVTPTVPA